MPSTHSLSRGFPLSRITSGRNTHSLQEKAVPAVSVVWPEDSNMTFRSKHRGSRCIRFPASGPFSLEGHCEWDNNISGHIGLGFAKPIQFLVSRGRVGLYIFPVLQMSVGGCLTRKPYHRMSQQSTSGLEPFRWSSSGDNSLGALGI